jgi:hypothetical protein
LSCYSREIQAMDVKDNSSIILPDIYQSSIVSCGSQMLVFANNHYSRTLSVQAEFSEPGAHTRTLADENTPSQLLGYICSLIAPKEFTDTSSDGISPNIANKATDGDVTSCSKPQLCHIVA